MSSNDDFRSFMEQSAPTSVRRLTKGERVRGRVVHIGADSVFVDLGSRADARVARLELQRPDGSLTVQVGDELEATVVDPHHNDGPLLVVTMGSGGGIDVRELQLALETGTPVEGRFSKAQKGGLEVTVGSTRAFCPASQVSTSYVAELEPLVGQTARFAVLEIKEEGRSVIVSRRKVLEQEKAEASRARLTEIKEGAILSGTVSSIQKFGAFVDLGGVEGLVHISEITRGRVERVDDVLSLGERVEVKVLSIELPEEGSKHGARIGLSMKALLAAAPAPEAAPAVPPPSKDTVLEGTVVKHLPHGVVVETKQGEGLVPARELEVQEGRDLRRAFPIGEVLQVVLLDAARGRLRFSATKVSEVQARNDFRDYKTAQAGESARGGGALAAALGKLSLDLPAAPTKEALARIAQQEQKAREARERELEQQRARAEALAAQAARTEQARQAQEREARAAASPLAAALDAALPAETASTAAPAPGDDGDAVGPEGDEPKRRRVVRSYDLK
ncbi:MAG: S1 RNA-binding domain-containing protein [Polyangiales bacterium]